MELILTNNSLFSNDKQFPLRGIFNVQKDNPPHQQEFSEVTFILEGEALHYSEPEGWVHTEAGDIWIIPPDGIHGYQNTKNLKIFNLLFVADQLPVPLLELYTHPQYKKLFSGDRDYWKSVGFYPRLHPGTEDMNDLTNLLHLFIRLQNQDLPGKIGIKYGLFMTIISRLCDIAMTQKAFSAPVKPLDISRIISYLNENYTSEIGISELIKLTAMSESTLRRHFRKAFGMGPIEYIRKFRLGIAAKLLVSTTYSVKEISQMCGFNNTSYFCRMFRMIYNKTPQDYRINP